MQTAVKSGTENTTLDVFKFAACIIIAATHLPSVFQSPETTLYFKQWFFRFCVPFFFVSTGYFFQRSSNRLLYLKRVFWLFALSYVLYLPMLLEGVTTAAEAFSRLRWNLVVGYEHLWYLSALLEGLVIWYVLEKLPVIRNLFPKVSVPAGFLLLMLGALLDEHYHLLNSSLLRTAGDFLLNFGGPRNVVFMGFPMLLLGSGIARWEKPLGRIPMPVLLGAWFVLRGLAWWECSYLLENLGSEITLDLSFFGCLPAVVLFLLSFRFRIPIPADFARLLRKLSEYVYVLHPLLAVLISRYLAPQPPALLASTIIMSCAVYVLLEKQFLYKK